MPTILASDHGQLKIVVEERILTIPCSFSSHGCSQVLPGILKSASFAFIFFFNIAKTLLFSIDRQAYSRAGNGQLSFSASKSKISPGTYADSEIDHDVIRDVDVPSEARNVHIPDILAF